jgi:antitoxin component YwqK of YwqJK toxin-antitoxin module|tara:strand:- start:80 stop:571 length:492 start_codon:yes stop_codon:yes gene_type:complete
MKILIFISIVWTQDVSCSKVEYYQNGNIEFCSLSYKDTLSGQLLPTGTGVHFTDKGVFDWCFLQKNTMVQGHLCRGKTHNFMTSFYPNGQLKTAWLAENEVIQGIPCSKFRFLSAVFVGIHGKTGQTSFYENGQLKYCELSKNTIIKGKSYKKGESIELKQAK